MGASNLYSATSFVISSKAPTRTATATATRDCTQHFRKGRGGFQVHSASHVLTPASQSRTKQCCVPGHATSEAGDTREADGTGHSGGASILLPSIRRMNSTHMFTFSVGAVWGAVGNHCKESKEGEHLKKNTEGLLPCPSGHHTRLHMAGSQGCGGVH